jgi:hypothetical protein
MPRIKLAGVGAAGAWVQHRETKEPKPDAARKLSLGSMSRRDCPKCQEREALFAGSICTACGADYRNLKTRQKRLPRALTVVKSAPLRAPIADDPETLLTLMRAKA